MSYLLGQEDRQVPRVANLSARESKRGGRVVYPSIFADRLARTVPATPPLPAPTRWFLDRRVWMGILGYVLIGACLLILAFGLVAPWVTQR